MDSATIQKVFSKSADDLLRYKGGDIGPAAVSVKVVDYVPNGSGNLLLTLDSPIDDTVGAFMYVQEVDMVLEKEVVTYPFYDRGTKTLCARFSADGLFKAIVADHMTLEVRFDLSFLIERAREYYGEFGDRIRYPDCAPSFAEPEMVFPRGFAPSVQQREAVSTILNSKLSYVWGAPGTGKTQMVLATAVMAYVRRRERIAIIAPTNNSVEQVLRGILKVIESDPEFGRLIDPGRDISRMGSATEAFIEDYPELCEPMSIASLISRKRKEIGLLRDVLAERAMDRAAGLIKALRVYVSERDMPGDRAAKRDNERRIAQGLEELRTALDGNRLCEGIFEQMDDTNTGHQLEVLEDRLFRRDRPKNAIP